MIKFFHSILSFVDLKIYQFKTPFSHLMNLKSKICYLEMRGNLHFENSRRLPAFWYGLKAQ